MSDLTQQQTVQEFEDERDQGSPEPRPAPQIIDQEPHPAPLTKRDLATRGIDALDRNRVDQVKVSTIAGGVIFSSALEVMEVAKMMATAGEFVPQHCRLNPGMCLGICFQAIEWHMSPFAVANKSYAVNGRVAWESQLVHAVIEARAPLRERLSVAYEGEKLDRVCIITGKFRDGTEREYRSPAFKDIRVKNSPLWKDDPDQQMFYYASRSWARKWCPDVLLGIYTREEMAAIEPEPATDGGQALHLRLASADRTEGHQPGAAERELANVASEAKTIQPAEGKAEPEKPTTGKKKPGKQVKNPAPEEQKRTTTLADPKKAVSKAEASKIADRAEAQSKARKQTATQKTDGPAAKTKVPEVPKNSAEYQVYASAWIGKVSDREDAKARWDGEREMREELAVPIKVRNELRAALEAKHGEM